MKKPLVIALFIAAVVISAALGNWGLTESSEGRYAEISREMYLTHDYVQPVLLGIHHYHKPPVTYYLTCLGYFIFGINEYGARFFLCIALLFQLLMVFKIAGLLYNNKTLSLAAALIYFSYPVVQIAAKNLTTDAYLTTFVFCSIYFFLAYKQNGIIKHLYLFYIFGGICFLTKGPVGILPQALFAVLYTRIFKTARGFNIHFIFAPLLGVIICASWFLILLLQNEKLLDYFLRYQLVDRVATNTFNRTKPFWYYFIFLPLLGLPAFCYFAEFLRVNSRSFSFKRNASALLLITLATLFVIFSASSSKLILYVLPLYLFIAILSAKYISGIPAKKTVVFENISFGFGFLLFTALLAACLIPLPVVLPKFWVTVSCIAGIASLIFLRRTTLNVHYLKAPLINAVGMVFLTFLVSFIMKGNNLEINSVKPLATFIKNQSAQKRVGNIVVYDYLLPSLAFYTGEQVITLNNGNSITEREIQFETNDRWKKSYFKLSGNRDSSVLAALLSKPNSYLIAQRKNPPPDSLSYLREKLSRHVSMGKWIIYF